MSEQSRLFADVWITLVNPGKASAPRSFLEPRESLRMITAGRRLRSARLLVGSNRRIVQEVHRHPIILRNLYSSADPRYQ